MKENVSFATTLKVRDSCLCLHAQRAARALARRFDEALRPVGLTNGQFSLLMALNRPSPITLTPLAEFLCMDRTTLTAAIKPLMRDGLVDMLPNPQDARSRQLHLTERGHEKLRAALPIWQETHKKIEAALGPLDLNTLKEGLAALS